MVESTQLKFCSSCLFVQLTFRTAMWATFSKWLAICCVYANSGRVCESRLRTSMVSVRVMFPPKFMLVPAVYPCRSSTSLTSTNTFILSGRLHTPTTKLCGSEKSLRRRHRMNFCRITKKSNCILFDQIHIHKFRNTYGFFYLATISRNVNI